MTHVNFVRECTVPYDNKNCKPLPAECCSTSWDCKSSTEGTNVDGIDTTILSTGTMMAESDKEALEGINDPETTTEISTSQTPKDMTQVFDFEASKLPCTEVICWPQQYI